MDFIEAVKILEKDCYSEMHKQGDFHKRLHLVNDELHYVEEQLYYDGTEKEYVPTAKDMLVEDWIVARTEIVDGIDLNDLNNKTIKNIEYIDYHFIFTLCNGKKYEFSGDPYGEASSVVEIKEITGE